MVATNESVRPIAASLLRALGLAQPNHGGWIPAQLRALPANTRRDAVTDVLPLVFGESTTLSEGMLDVRGRRLMGRLEASGRAIAVRHEVRDDDGCYHVCYSFRLRSEAAKDAPAEIQRANNEFTTLYDRLPEVAWKHTKP